MLALVLGLVAATYFWLWRLDHEHGIAWLAIGMALMAAMAATFRFHRPSGPYLMWSPWHLLLVGGLMALALGLVDFLEVPARARRAARTLTLLPPAAYGLLVGLIGLTGVEVPRSLGQLPVGSSFLAMGLLAAWAARREPGAGHAWVAASLLAVPAIAVAMAILRVDQVSLRPFAFAPMLVLALMVVPSSLLRRRRALEAEVAMRRAAEAKLSRLNSSLEEAVAERTAGLHDLIAGLEGFNRSVSHDLRGPLGGIAGLARMADQALLRGDEAPARRALPLIAEQAETSARLVAAMLTLARVGDAALTRVTVDLGLLASQVVDQLRLEHGAAPLPRIELQTMPAVQADPELLRAVFVNLIGNAIKFTPAHGAGRIEVGARRTGDEWTIQVRDNGVGFDGDAAASLFAPFVRLHGQGFDGHGIGLSIVRRAVERHGGRVWAESQPGQGAVFSFSLPA